MKYFWKILMDVYKFARGIIALIVLMLIGTVIWSMYQVGKVMEETRHAPAVVAETATARIVPPARVAASAAVPVVASAATVAADSKPAPIQTKSPVSIAVKHIGRGATNYDVSLVVMLKNDGEKAIKATKGAVIVYNAFGDELTHLVIENAKTILPGKAVKEAGEWQIIGNHEALKAINGDSTDASKLTFAFIPKVILFQDGSKFEQ
jgi:hypothetical protein